MPLLQPHPFTVDDYHRMAETGILCKDDRVELLEGQIVAMSPIGNVHQACVDRLNRLFIKACGDEAIVRIQGSVVLNDRTQPQPDVALLRPRESFYADGAPGPGDILLLVEVCDSSVDKDLRIKMPLYARVGVSEFWLVDIPQSRIDIYRTPTPDGYADTRTAHLGDTISPAAFPDVSFTVASIFGQ